MPDTKRDIIAQLQKDLLLLQGYKPPGTLASTNMGLGSIEKAFPNACFPTGAIHEFISLETEHAAATSGFVSGLLGNLMRAGKACIWISRSRNLFPPAINFFGVAPDQIIFIDLQKDKDLLWAMEEALKCEGLAAVVGEIDAIDFTASRRLQLAVEKSRVTGFLLRHRPRILNTIAGVARWKITPLPSETEDGMPGVGFPHWKVELLKVRNGKPGCWQVQWPATHFQHTYTAITAKEEEQVRKTG